MSTPHEFDPHQVPRFPVITVELSSENEGVALVQGRTYPLPDGIDAHSAAVDIAAGIIAERGLTHARVSASSDGVPYLMVVSATGERYDLSSPTEPARAGTPARRAKKPLWPLVVAAVAIIAVLSVAVVALVATMPSRPAAQPAGPSTPPPAELPVVAAAPWTTHADWAIPVAKGSSTAVVATDDAILTITEDGRLTSVDPATGIIRWTSPIPRGTPTAGPVLTRAGGQTMIAVTTNRALLLWPLTGGDAPTLTADLGNGEDVTFDGTSPLIASQGQSAKTIDRFGALVTRTIPAGATALRADDGTITAANELGQIWKLDTADVHVPDPALTIGEGTVIGTAGTIIVIRGTDSIRVHNIDTGKQIRTIDRSGTSWTVSPDRQQASLGQTLLATDTGAATTIPGDAWATKAMTDHRIYGTLRGSALSSLPIPLPKAAPDPAVSAPDAQAPLAEDEDHAYYIADNDDGDPLLYAVTPVGDRTPSPTNSPR